MGTGYHFRFCLREAVATMAEQIGIFCLQSIQGRTITKEETQVRRTE